MTGSEYEAALRVQRQRGQEMRAYLRRLGDEAYNPHMGLTWFYTPFFPRFVGYSIVGRSLEYAILLLHSDDRLYGGDDAEEANRIIRTVLEYQDLDRDSDSYGNFRWMTHWRTVKDRNAVSFLVPGLTYVYQNFPGKLEDETRRRLEAAFLPALAGIRGHKVRWQYSNIFHLNIASLVGLSRVLDDAAAHDEAVADFDTWLDGTANDGIHEFNSPTYTPVTLYAMESAWANTPDQQFRGRLERTMDIVTYQLAMNMFPTGFLGGTPSRAYQGDALYGMGFSAAYFHLKFGIPWVLPPEGADRHRYSTDIGPMLVHLTHYGYVPPKPVRELALCTGDHTEIHDRLVSRHSRRTHVLTPRFSIASQSTEDASGLSAPSYVLIARHTSLPRRSIAFLPDESFSRQPAAAFVSRQDGARVVGRLHYPLADGERARFLADHTLVCEPRLLLGPRGDIADVRVGNVDWGGRPVNVQPHQPICGSFGDIWCGVVAVPLDAAGCPVEGRIRLCYGPDDELRVALRIFGGPDVGEGDPVDVLVLVEVRDAGTDLAEYADELAGWTLTRADDHDPTAGFCADHPRLGALAYPYTDADPDPIGNALHASPGLVLHPGDLKGLVDSDARPPFGT